MSPTSTSLQGDEFKHHALLIQISEITAREHKTDELFGAIQELAADTIGHQLFTVMAFDSKRMRVQRLYSSNTTAYPPGGAKEKRDTAWGRLVLEKGQHFIGESRDDIEQYFDDSTVMFDLGLHSILNVPVKLNGQTLGTMNLCNESPGYYNDSHLEWGGVLTALLAASLLAYQNDPDFSATS